MGVLKLWQSYTRHQVHDIFSPETAFHPGGGTWGMQGIVKVPESPGSYVFYVTFGTTQGHHDFDETITEDGVLTWQSQPAQTFNHPIIRDLIEHDDRLSSIFLFLRTRKLDDYTYCGRLAYVTHDEERERPVHFQWQLLDWPAPPELLTALGDRLVPASATAGARAAETPSTSVTAGSLQEVPAPDGHGLGGSTTSTFKAQRLPFHPDQDARNKKLGLAGEKLVLNAERSRLTAAGRPDLASQVVHVSVVQGDGLGYDIKSFTADGDVRHLEVKTTRYGATSGFFVSPNEVAFSNAHPESFVLVRVFSYQDGTNSGSCFRRLGRLEDSFDLTTSQYRASMRP